MLKIAHCLEELDFGALMGVYVEGNRENGDDKWPEEPEDRRLQLAEQDFYNYLREDFFRQPGVKYAFWLENGVYISALRLEPYRDGQLLEALETAPDQRNRGCARRLIEEALRGEKGKIYSHVSKRNAPSLAVHRACGFRQILDYAAYVDGSVNRRAVTLLRELPE